MIRSAKNNLEKALQKDPQLPAAKQLQMKIESIGSPGAADCPGKEQSY